MNAATLILWTPLLVFIYAVIKVFYNLFLHPLRTYPGPLLARASSLEYQRQTLGGYSHIWIHELHKKYGPVVRLSPNVLDYTDPEVWKDVYGHKASSFTKDLENFYGPDSYGNPAGLLRADNVSHGRQRKQVSHAFSDKALRDQEELLKGYVNTLVEQLKKIAETGEKTNLVKWLNFTTFDIMADLAFGESLGQLTSSMYSPWVEASFAFAKGASLARIGREWGLSKLMNKILISAETMRKRQSYIKFGADKVDRRMSRKTERPDIWTYVTKNRGDEAPLAPTELHSNGTLFMLAGTETTATGLSGLTYMLLRHPDKMARLTEEVRTAFKSTDEMTMAGLSRLPYLQACVEEALRLYPPVAVGLPRVAPKGGAEVCGRYVPGGAIVQTSMFSTYRSPANFKNPDSFHPERNLPEGAAEYESDRKDALNPFSIGPRNCLGKNLAYLEMRLILSTLLLRFDIELCAESANWMDQECHFLWEKHPLIVKLKLANCAQ